MSEGVGQRRANPRNGYKFSQEITELTETEAKGWAGGVFTKGNEDNEGGKCGQIRGS
jgi:hypothetical protein